MKIIGIGNALMDILVILSDESVFSALCLDKGGMTLIDDNEQEKVDGVLQTLDTTIATGGSAGNAMLALAHLGAKPGFIGRVGRDDMGARLRACYNKVGIDARLIEGEEHTGVANTFITADGERTFATCLGAAALMKADEVSETMLEGYDLLHIEGYLVQNHDLIESVARMAKQRGMLISIDLASYNVVAADLDFFRHLVAEYVDIVFANEEESAAFTQGKEPEEALLEIASMARVAVVKLGGRGSIALSEGLRASYPGLNVGVVDTTAAGDFFAGGFLHAYAQGASLEQCLAKGSLLAAHVIRVIGTQVTEAQWEEIRNAK